MIYADNQAIRSVAELGLKNGKKHIVSSALSTALFCTRLKRLKKRVSRSHWWMCMKTVLLSPQRSRMPFGKNQNGRERSIPYKNAG